MSPAFTDSCGILLGIEPVVGLSLIPPTSIEITIINIAMPTIGFHPLERGGLYGRITGGGTGICTGVDAGVVPFSRGINVPSFLYSYFIWPLPFLSFTKMRLCLSQLQ